MGICYSTVERQEAVARCKARRRYMKHLVKARQEFAATQVFFLRSLRATGATLLQFANDESHLHLQHHLPPSPLMPPPPPPPMTPSSNISTSVTASPLSSSFDYWDPFVHSVSKPAMEESKATETASEAVVTAAAVADGGSMAKPSVVSMDSKDTASEISMVDTKNSKDLVEIVKGIDEYFLKAAEAGVHVSLLLGAPSSIFSNQRTKNKVYNCSGSLSPLLCSWGSNSKLSGCSESGRSAQEMKGEDGDASVSKTNHCSTIETLYSWEKQLYREVKNAESIKTEHGKKVSLLRKQKAKGADHAKIEKCKKEIEKLESGIMVSSQAIETTSEEIIRLRETQLYPQLLELVKEFSCMWRSISECHQVQNSMVQQLEFLHNVASGAEPTPEVNCQSTLQLELEVQKWHLTFCNLMKAHRDYICSLTGWLRLSLFQFNHPPNKTQQNSSIYSLSEEWQLAVDKFPDKVASEGIKDFLTVIHAIVQQQADELKQKKRSEAAFKELEETVAALQSLECKYGTEDLMPGKLPKPISDKRAKVETLRGKAKEEKMKHEKCVSTTRAMVLNNLQTGLPNLFEAMVSYSSVCMDAFQLVHDKFKSPDHQSHDMK